MRSFMTPQARRHSTTFRTVLAGVIFSGTIVACVTFSPSGQAAASGSLTSATRAQEDVQVMVAAAQQTVPPAANNIEPSPLASKEQALLPGDRIVIGTVTEIKAGLIKVEQEDSLQPRFLPLYQAREKDMKIREGDRIKLIFNDQQLLVDFHPLGRTEGDHKIIRGVVDQQMPVGQERVVIKTQQGETVSFFVRPIARSTVASIPVGVDAVFLADETGKIVDATFGSEEAVEEAAQEYKRMSNLTAPHTRIEGMVIDPSEDNTMTIETSQGKKWTYPLRPLLKTKMGSISKGERLTLLIDSDNHVIDVAQFP